MPGAAATIAAMKGSLPRRKVWRHRKVISEHGFDKLHLLDCTLAEFEAALEGAEVIEEHELGIGSSKELLLVVDWKRPLHVVVVVDESGREERIVTVYEPVAGQWSADYRRRR